MVENGVGNLTQYGRGSRTSCLYIMLRHLEETTREHAYVVHQKQHPRKNGVAQCLAVNTKSPSV